MVEMIATTPPATGAGAAHLGAGQAALESASWRWLAATLDEIDYGMLLLTKTDEVVHINHAALAELDEQHPLELSDGQLRARLPLDVARLNDALRDAERGLRHLVSLGD